LLRRALQDQERGLGDHSIHVPETVLKRLSLFCNGDARIALNALELAARHVRGNKSAVQEITLENLEQVLQQKGFVYDKQGEEHFNLISALHKTMRNSDPDAALYWLARMLEAGEDPLYIARRIVRFASEDVGLADPRALGIALEAKDAMHFLGLPEGNVALAQAVIYLSLAPKSNSAYVAYGKVRHAMETTQNAPVPLHLRNAPTKLMKDLDYGRGYEYAHDMEEKLSAMPGLPPGLVGKRFYQPTDEGLEKKLKERLDYIAALRSRLSKK
jgi:putative ATPase